jgi:O-methyltransferase involved in polyketide biosynthesis
MAEPAGDLSITALYTSQAWAWGGLPCAELLATREGRRVFDATNLVLAAARLVRPDLAPLRQALLHRHVMIDHLAAEAGAGQVLELAAGLSRRGAALSRDPALRYTEVDLAPVVARKRALFERTAAGREVLARPGFRLVAGDVLDAPLEAWVAPGVPLLVVAEGLMVYLEAPARRRLWAKVAALAAASGRVRFVFDLVPGAEEPGPGRVGRVLAAAMTRFTGGRGFARDRSTRQGVLAELGAAGFAEVRAVAAADVARAWGLPQPDAPTRVVLFDGATAAPPASGS